MKIPMVLSKDHIQVMDMARRNLRIKKVRMPNLKLGSITMTKLETTLLVKIVVMFQAIFEKNKQIELSDINHRLIFSTNLTLDDYTIVKPSIRLPQTHSLTTQNLQMTQQPFTE